jgi:hypothetical protein
VLSFDNECRENQSAQDEPASALPPEREVINANLCHLSNWLCGQCHDAPENGMTRGLYCHPIRDTHFGANV